VRIVHGSANELTQEQQDTIAQLETRHGESYVTPFPWGAYATFENGTETDTMIHINRDGKETP
jgi:hypothetical protein